MNRMRALIAEDEPLARERLARVLEELDCAVVAAFQDGPDLLDWVRDHGTDGIDVLFLDIQMPSLTGMEALAAIASAPPTVFVTAHKDCAFEAWNTEAHDFILKPVFPDRVQQALERVRSRRVKPLSPEALRRIFPPLDQVRIKAGRGHVFLPLRHVHFFELADDKVWAHAGDRPGETSWTSLKEVEAAFPGAGMIRIQRHLLLRPESVLGYAPVVGGRLEVRLPRGVNLIVSRDKVAALRQRLAPG